MTVNEMIKQLNKLKKNGFGDSPLKQYVFEDNNYSPSKSVETNVLFSIGWTGQQSHIVIEAKPK